MYIGKTTENRANMNAKGLMRRLAVAAVVFLMVAGAAGSVYLEKTARPVKPQPQAQVAPPSRTMPSAPSVQPSPGYTAPELPRGSLSKPVEDGRVVVLCFLSTSSGPSIAQLSALEGVADGYPDVEILMVAVGEKDGTLSTWLESRSVSPRLAAHAVPDPGGSHARRWSVTATPTTFVVRADGVVDWLRVGVAEHDELAAAVRRAGDGSG